MWDRKRSRLVIWALENWWDYTCWRDSRKPSNLPIQPGVRVPFHLPPPPPPQFLHQHSPVHNYRLQSGNRIRFTTAFLPRSLSSVHASSPCAKLQDYLWDNTSPVRHLALRVNYKGDLDRCKSTTMWNTTRRKQNVLQSVWIFFSRIVFFADLVDLGKTFIYMYKLQPDKEKPLEFQTTCQHWMRPRRPDLVQ